MKKIKGIAAITVAGALALVAGAACATRLEEPTTPTTGEACAKPRDVEVNPNACLSATGQWKNTGWINSYRQMYEVSVRNKTAFKVERLAGEVVWTNADGTVAGTVPFTTVGMVPPHGVTQFTERAGTLTTTKIQSTAPSYTIRITQASAE